MIDVTCAVIRNELMEVLVVRRGDSSDHPFLWEFPGGKVNNGEIAEDAVIREVDEELKMNIVITGSLSPREHNYGYRKIRLIPFICDTLMEKPVLSEHIDYKWVGPADLEGVDFTKADIPVAQEYMELYADTYLTPEKHQTAGIFTSDADNVVVSDDELKNMIYRMHGSAEIGWIASSAVLNPLLLQKFLEFTDDGDTRLVFRASWALSKACMLNPDVFMPIMPLVVEKLLNTKNGSAMRSFLKIISITGTASLTESLQGRLVEYCFSMLRSPFSAIAVKVYSLDVLYDISLRFPGLTHELAAIAGMLPGDAPAGVKAKYREVMRKISHAPGEMNI